VKIASASVSLDPSKAKFSAFGGSDEHRNTHGGCSAFVAFGAPWEAMRHCDRIRERSSALKTKPMRLARNFLRVLISRTGGGLVGRHGKTRRIQKAFAAQTALLVLNPVFVQ
jgi:hypothetical protein